MKIDETNQPKAILTCKSTSSRAYDSESGLNYFYHRYYNPAIGRFTSEDPIGINDGLNLFNFVDNNSTNTIDPYGLFQLNGHVKGHPVKYSIDIPNNPNFRTGVTIPGNVNVQADKCECIKGNWFPRFTMNFELDYWYVSGFQSDFESVESHEFGHVKDLLFPAIFMIKELKNYEKNKSFSDKSACERFAKRTAYFDNISFWFANMLSIIRKDVFFGLD